MDMTVSSRFCIPSVTDRMRKLNRSLIGEKQLSMVFRFLSVL